jgi:hypothetical protein
MRCHCILPGAKTGARVHIFGYASDIERVEILYTSLLIQMSHGLARATVPAWTTSPRAWRRSWLLGFAAAVIARIRDAERTATENASADRDSQSGRSAALVLASREQVVTARAKEAYPLTRKTRITYSGTGYRDGHDQGNRDDIGGTRLNRDQRRSLR